MEQPLSLLKLGKKCEESNGGQQMSPELLNTGFQRNPHNAYNCLKSLTAPCFQHINQVCGSSEEVQNHQYST